MSFRKSMRWHMLRLGALGLGLALISTLSAREPLDRPMNSSPEPVPQEVRTAYFVEVIPLWTRALDRPETDYRVQTADAIRRAAQIGMPGLEVTIPKLQAGLESPESRAKTKEAFAAALVALDAKESRELFERLLPEASVGLTEILEPALAKWGSETTQQIWRDRLNNPETRPAALHRAIRCAMIAGDRSVLSNLQALALDRNRTPATRDLAAEAIGQLASSDQEGFVESLAWGEDTLAPLLAARILAEHSGERAKATLDRIVREADHPAAIIAAQRLRALDPQFLFPFAFELADRQDKTLRQLAVTTLELRQEAADVARLLTMMDDRHPEVRSAARAACERLSSQEAHRENILAFVADVLATRRGPEHWRILEQSAVFAGNLDQESVAASLVVLLKEERREVACSSAWALQKIQVESTFSELVTYCSQILDQVDAAATAIAPLHEEQLIHLMQLFGMVKYQPAKEVLVRMVPKNFNYGLESRAAAVWSLGFVMEGTIEPGLVEQLVQRMLDGRGIPPEYPSVRKFCAATLARMGAKDRIADIESLQNEMGLSSTPGWVAAWSLNQLDGRPIPEVGPRSEMEVNWYLEPLMQRDSNSSDSPAPTGESDTAQDG